MIDKLQEVKKMKSLERNLMGFLYITMGIFIALTIYIFFPLPLEVRKVFFPYMAVLSMILLIFGVVILYLSFKECRKLKKFLFLVGISSLGPFIFSLLHNLFYGLGMTYPRFEYIFLQLHKISFIVALLVSPILFYITAIGSIIIVKKEKRVSQLRDPLK